MARICAHVCRVVPNNGGGGHDLSLQKQNVQPSDSFNFHIVGHGILRGAGAEYERHTFSNNNQDFLVGYLRNNQPYVTIRTLSYLSQRVITQVQTLCPLQRTKPPLDPTFPTFEPQVFRLYLEICVQMDHHHHDIFQLGPVRMIPASNEAIIQSLKKVASLSETCCTICMNEDDDEEEVKELSVMPCGHGFHHRCIVQWLNTSHMCPICRYALPTANGG